jgi:protocatechuate 3,4-dioxygenase beta subunit
MSHAVSRRSFLQRSLTLGASVAIAGSGIASVLSSPAAAHAQTCTLTEPNLEGPFYRAGAPTRASLAGGVVGIPLVLTGHVLRGCRATIAELDVWQADSHGDYDNLGFGLRGCLRTDDDGAYRLETIVPGHYLNGPQYRPAHVHVKVRVPGQRELTTQLYFEGDPYNAIDPWYRPALALHTVERSHGLVAQFDFSV